jgi:AraC family transcriptional regulator
MVGAPRSTDEQLSSAGNNLYIQSINRVVDYIEAHLGENLSLERLAEVAHFSPYHFHRIFASHTGEPLHRFIVRHRLERGARLIATEPERTILDIALACGFSTNAAFTRAFRSHYGVTPSAYRGGKSKIGTTQSKESKAPPVETGYIEHHKRLQIWHGKERQRVVELVDESELWFAYVRHVGPYAGDAGLFERLWRQFGEWAGPRGYFEQEGVRYFATYHNDPELTETPMLRVSVGCSVPAGTQGSGAIGVMTLPAGLYARTEFALGPADYARAWTWVYATWLPASGYVPADGLAYEEFTAESDPDLEPGKHRVTICLPVQLLRR